MRVAIIGGGPAGAAAAMTLARAGIETYLIERDLHHDKPCGGGIPSGALTEFGISDDIFERKVTKVGVIAPSGFEVVVGVRHGFLGMVDRRKFDASLRERAIESGAILIEGLFTGFSKKELLPCGWTKEGNPQYTAYTGR